MPYLPTDSNSGPHYPAISRQGGPRPAMAPSWNAPASRPPSQLLEYWQVIRSNFALICILALVGAGVGWLVALIRPAMYQARTVLDIRSLNEDFLNPREGTPMGTSGTVLPESYLQTEIKILQSDSIRKRALDGLMRQKLPGGVASKPEPAPAWRAALGILDPANMPFEQLFADAGRRVKVRALGNTRIVDMLCDARDAQLAADVCNGIARTYIQYNIEARSKNTQETSDWLSSQLDDVRRRLTKAESELKDAARESSVILDSDAENLAQEKLRQLQTVLSQSQAERINKESEYQVASSTPSGSLPLALDVGPIRDYRLRLTELRRQVAELSSTMTPAHYQVRALTNQIAEIESALKTEQTNLISRLRADYQTAMRRESMLQMAYDKQAAQVIQRGDKAVHYNMLKREVDSERKLYDTLLQRVQEVGLAAAMRASTINVVDVAAPPLKPYSPDMLASVGIGFFGGSCIGLAFSFLRLRSDRTLQNPGDAVFHLQLREIGVIPTVRIPSIRVLLDKTRRAPIPAMIPGRRDEDGPHIIEAGNLPTSRRAPANSIALATWLRNPPELAEAFCSAMNSLLFAGGRGERARVIVVTSPEAGDGKTTAATNLAVALAEIGRRVVLVDGDLRKPRLHTIFNVDCQGGGLAKLLDEEDILEERSLANFVFQTQVDNLFVLPTSAAREGISAKLHSGNMSALLQRLRAEFDIVIIDSPPMLHLSDARVLGWLSDGVLLVFRSRKTTRESALAAADCLIQDGIAVLGTILNDWNPRKGTRYGAYSSYMGAA